MPKTPHDQAAYKGMLKATSLMAGAKLTTIFISLLRTKVIALLLGPGGMGVVNLIGSSVEMTRVIFACGLDGATIRKVANAAASDDPALLDQAYRIAARTALFIGTASCVALSLASPFLSAKFLGAPEQFWWYVLGGCSLVFTPLLGVELAFLQGLKRSRDLAICQIIASIAGTVLTISLVAAMGKIGAIIALLPVAVASLFIHHHFLKRYRPKIKVPLPYNPLLESRKLLKLGSGFAVNGIWLSGSGWLNLLFIQSYYGPTAGVLQVGLYGAASTLANFYIGILISSMATEFYPSLIQVANDRPAMNRLLNQQTLLIVCIGVPITLALLVFSPWALSLLYSHQFTTGTDLLRWMTAGMALRFIACPLGFSLLAIGSPRLIALSELAMGFVTIATSYIMLQFFGLKGIGMALFIANGFYLIGIFITMQKKGISWNLATVTFVAETLGILAACLSIVVLMPPIQGCLAASALSACYLIHLAVIIRREVGGGFSDLFRKLRNLTRRNPN